MQKPVIELKKYQLEQLQVGRLVSDENSKQDSINLSANVGLSGDYKLGNVSLSVIVKDYSMKRELSATIEGYFIINSEESEELLFQYLYVNGTAILYPYLRAIISVVSTVDSSEAMLLPTINVLELLKNSDENE